MKIKGGRSPRMLCDARAIAKVNRRVKSKWATFLSFSHYFVRV